MKFLKALPFAAMAILVPVAVPAAAEEPAAVAPAPAYSTSATEIGTLLDNPQTRAVLDKHMPAFASNPQIEMARAMTLRQIQSFAADMLKQLGVSRVKILTNNPAKIAALKAAGLDVVAQERVIGRPTPQNVGYLAAKRDRAGH